MSSRTLIASALLLATLAVPPAMGQQQQPAPTTQQQDQDDLRQRMQAMMMQIMQRLGQQGINPAEFFQPLQQGMMDGSMDMGDMEKMMLEKGLVDQKQIDEIQEIASRAILRTIRDSLNVTDDEWGALMPKVQRILIASSSLGGNPMQQGRGGMGMAAMANSRGATSEAAMAYKAVRKAVKDPNISPEEITTKLNLYREAHERALLQLQAAQKDLTDVLTLNQEAALVSLGLLQ